MHDLLNRFLWALANETSTVVQAASAVITAVATIVLVRVTAQYVRLTNDLARSSAAQFSAMVQPKLALMLNNGYPLSFGDIQVIVRNVGENLVKIKRVLIIWRDGQDSTHCHTVSIAQDRVLLPEREGYDRIDELVKLTSTEIASVRATEGVDEYSVTFNLVVDCSDMGDATQHCYTLTQESGLLHQRKYYECGVHPRALLPRIKALLPFGK